jgi:hypothetical protein
MTVFGQIPIFANTSYAESVGHVVGGVIAISIIVGFEVFWIVSVIKAFKRATWGSIILGWMGAFVLFLQLVAAAVFLITRLRYH